MPRDINDVYTLPAGNPVIEGTVIDVDWANPTLADIAQALTDSLDKSDPQKARDTLLLGNSATEDRQTNAFDPDPASLALVGMFGFGGAAQLISAAGSLDALRTSQISRLVKFSAVSAISVGGPAAQDTIVLHMAYSATTGVQIAASLGTEGYYVRRHNGTAWSAWSEVTLKTLAGVLSINSASLKVIGVTDGSSVAAGEVGEVIEATRTTPIGFASATIQNVTSIILTPGDWEVVGSVKFGGTSPNTYYQAGSISDVSGSQGDELTVLRYAPTDTSLLNNAFVVPPRRFNISANKTLYLIASALFNTGNQNAVGTIRARRVR